jgi:opacity protein-like surface antigen
MKRIACLIAVAVLWPAVARADIHAGDHTLAINLGTVIPLSNIDVSDAGGGKAKAGAAGFNGGGQYLFSVNPTLALGADFNYSDTGKEESTSIIPGGDTEISYKSAIFMFLMRANLLTGSVVPYFVGGAGLHSTTLNADMKPQPGFVWLNTGTTETRNILNDTGSSFAGAIGFGTDFYLNENVFLGFEGRYQYMGNSTYNTTTLTALSTGVTAIKGTISAFNLSGRLGYKFGRGGNEAPKSDAHTGPTPI